MVSGFSICTSLLEVPSANLCQWSEPTACHEVVRMGCADFTRIVY